MPAFGKTRGGDLTDDQIRAIVGYLRSAGGKPATPNGPALFQSNCLTCHGSAGDKMRAANLSSREFLDGWGRAGLRLTVSRGKGGMPAFARDWGGPLQPEEVRAVVAYLWTLARGASGEPPVSADDGKALYASFCVACHGQSGGQFPAADLTSAAFLTKRTDDELVEVTNDGRGIMPGFGPPRGQLSVEQITAIVGYLRSMAR
jgi:cbb3-type cytochrome c oxidase subunit III